MDKLQIYNSILSDVDTTLKEGDRCVDPFNILDVFSILIDENFICYFNNIDTSKLNTSVDFDIEYWLNNIPINILNRSNDFIIKPLDLDTQVYILKFAWWCCNCLLQSYYSEQDKSEYAAKWKNLLTIEQIAKPCRSNYELYAYQYIDPNWKMMSDNTGKFIWADNTQIYYLNIVAPDGGQLQIKHRKNNYNT